MCSRHICSWSRPDVSYMFMWVALSAHIVEWLIVSTSGIVCLIFDRLSCCSCGKVLLSGSVIAVDHTFVHWDHVLGSKQCTAATVVQPVSRNFIHYFSHCIKVSVFRLSVSSISPGHTSCGNKDSRVYLTDSVTVLVLWTVKAPLTFFYTAPRWHSMMWADCRNSSSKSVVQSCMKRAVACLDRGGHGHCRL